MPTDVNSQITDSVTQVNTEVVGMSPGVSLSNSYTASSTSLNIGIENATNAQHAMNQINEATTSVGVSLIYKVGSGIA